MASKTIANLASRLIIEKRFDDDFGRLLLFLPLLLCLPLVVFLVVVALLLERGLLAKGDYLNDQVSAHITRLGHNLAGDLLLNSAFSTACVIFSLILQ